MWRQNAFQHNGQAGLAAQPGDVSPARGDGHHAVEHPALPGCQRRLVRRHAGQVHCGHAVGQCKTGALLGVAHAGQRRVHRQHQRAIAGGFGTLHQLRYHGAVVLPVQLEPQGRRCGGSDVFQRRAGQRAHQHAAAHHAGGVGGAALGVGVYQFLVGHRRQQNRHGQLQPRQAAAAVAALHVGQHAGVQAVAGKGLQVGRMAQFVGSGAIDIGAGVGRHHALGVALVVGGGYQVGGNVIQVRAHGGKAAGKAPPYPRWE